MTTQDITTEQAYQADLANMLGRFVIFDGEVHRVSNVYIGSTGVHYLLHRDSDKRFQVAYPEECASCWFGGLVQA